MIKQKPTMIDIMIKERIGKIEVDSRLSFGNFKIILHKAMYSLAQELRRKTEVEEKKVEVEQGVEYGLPELLSLTEAPSFYNKAIKAQAKRWDDLGVKL
jgi:hypothetical protein